MFSSMGPPDGTVIVSVCNLDYFPSELHSPVIGKLDQLGISPSISKFVSPNSVFRKRLLFYFFN